ncbi:MAG TPA: hypothetical protein VMI31_18005 [Fimbriimonadaceae bacterium]|nr:hypothetical protein [Fimbriimonadaceae bacterium]
MYVFTENAFLSLVAHHSDERLLEVRAQFKGDIERTFPESEVGFDPAAEFPYSTSIPRDRVVERIALRVQHIGYRHFNPNSDEPWRQEAYTQVETVLRMAHRDAPVGET